MRTFFVFILCISVCFLGMFLPYMVYAGEDTFTQKDRELLIRLDERLAQIDKRFEQIDKRFEQVDKRFEQIDKRFEQVDKRFAELREDMNERFRQVDKRFESMENLLIAIVGAFAAIVAVAIGFAIWDRRTMIRPFEEKVKSMEDDIMLDRKSLETLFEVLRNYSRKHPDLADILKQFSIL